MRRVLSLFSRKKQAPPAPPVLFTNTLTGAKEPFVPLREGRAGMYNCGPTVYDFQHIGNLRAYVFADLVRRILEWNSIAVKQVVNITDVGHLVSDGDEGEDKMELGAKRAGKSTKAVAKEVTKAFIDDLKLVNIDTRRILFPKATDHIDEQVALVSSLEEKGYAYRTRDGVYFDTSRFPGYGKLGNIDVRTLKEGARVETNPEKRNPADFALWKLSAKPGVREQEWESPWGIGFPGWHAECSAMSMKYLGKTFDIHTGGIDHIPVHHNNEIAQSESATGKPLARVWMHVAFITIEGKKISKSVGNTIYLRNIVDRGFSPLAYRYLLLSAHYRTPVNFTWEALEGAQAALFRLHRHLIEKLGTKSGTPIPAYVEKFRALVNDDLDTPRALALLWELVRDETLDKKDKRATLLEFDTVLGLGLSRASRKHLGILAGEGGKVSIESTPAAVRALVAEREEARTGGNYARADELRDEIVKAGYAVTDTPKGPEITKSL